MVIASLRGQLNELFTQVTQLNGKLVKSYDRISDLEDTLHDTSSALRTTTLKVSQLELERTQHMSDLSAGLLVEKSHVTSELNRLMDRATEEAARRGQAETARQAIEKELGDLSANLFEQANKMVREANLLRAQADRRAHDAEEALRTAEEAVGGMQIQMQSLKADKDRTEGEMVNLRVLVDKGKWVERQQPHIASPAKALRLLSSHVPYEEFLLFVAHLRSLRPQPIPAMSTLLPLPFLARITLEDSDPTLRLDLAPALNWLSRRAVAAAVNAGSLNIEPVTTAAFLRETSTMNAPAALSSIVCALCGKQVHPNETHPPRPQALAHRPSNSGSWNVFKPNGTSTNGPSRSSSSAVLDIPSRPSSRNSHPIYQSQFYVFRVTATAPGSSSQKPTTYALCSTGWCLPRLRATCALWHFIRTRVVERIWEEEMPTGPATPTKPPRSNSGSMSIAGAIGTIGTIVNGVGGGSSSKRGEAPPVPPRRQSAGRVGSLLGMLGGGNKTPTTPPKASSTQLTLTREKPSLSARSPPNSARSPTSTTPTSRRRPSQGSQGSIKSPVRSPPAVPPRKAVPPPVHVDKKPDHEVEHHIDEHGPPAEVLFELDGHDGPRTPVAANGHASPTKEVPTLAVPVIPPRARPVSASVVPLPISPPTTPEPGPPSPEQSKPQTAAESAAAAPAVTPAQRAVTSSPAVSRSASPAPAINGRNSPALTNGRGSPAPPPVPKRAAGRKRAATIMRDAAQTPPPGEKKQLEPVISEEAEEPKPPVDATVETAAPEPVAVSDTLATTEVSPTPAEAPAAAEAAPAIAEAPAAPEAAPAAAAEPAPTATEPTPAAEVVSNLPASAGKALTPALSVEVDAPAIAQSTSTAVPDTKPADITSSPPADKPKRPAALTVDSLAVPVSPGPAESPLLSAMSPGLMPEPPREKDDDSKEPPQASVEPAPASELESGAQYVGETTWEERSWKEIVRLREEMFWARIGCVR
ncbi:hypothetical protein AURDEDRAFT_95594 [Auricularia subglabra TFB-10046 SS5]|nr:hypothetical protein AURDEDRAFT_95594 [Auricularia subglabra TFB-10046 SS5]